jgi:NTP pyrophosphatase (non-canonical NTP hydrolase)
VVECARGAGPALNLEKLPALAEALHQRFGGREPFEIMTRLLEECGELAQEVNHFQGGETKLAKHGAPSKEKFAKEVMDVLRIVFQIVKHYKLESELERMIEETYDRSVKEGLILESSQSEMFEYLVARVKALPRRQRLDMGGRLETQNFYERLGYLRNRRPQTL